MAQTLDPDQTEFQRLAEIRHDIHAHPELGYQEHRTSGVVQRELTALGIKHVAGLARGTGVLGYLPATHNPESAPTVALRADMDALPILENTGLPYASTTPGTMHACGHDGHTTVLIGTAGRLAHRSERPNNVLFLFQPAEEGGGGGHEMVKDGALDGRVIGKPADCIFGLHGTGTMAVGEAMTRPGPMMASADSFTIQVRGKGGHAAMPHTGIDPILITAHIVTALQSIASRNINPVESVVVTIGKITAGTANNIIPNTAEMLGTLRTLNEANRTFAMKQLPHLVSSVAEAFGGSATLEFNQGYPVTANDANLVTHLRKTLSTVLHDGMIQADIDQMMGAEDFSFYGRAVPACFYFIGVRPPGQETYPNLHAPEYNFTDEAIPVGVNAMTALALSNLP